MIRLDDGAAPGRRPGALPARSLRWELGFILALSTVGLGTVVLVHVWKAIPFGLITRDPATVANFPVYIGLLSNLGLLLWAAAAGICSFAGALLMRARVPGELPRFLLASGAYTLLLTLDDAFLVHETVLPKLIGVHEDAVLAGYGALGLVYLLRFRATIVGTELRLLAAAIGFFAASIVLDVFPQPLATQYLLEDGAKFVGIASWLAYLARTSADALVQADSAAAPAAPERVPVKAAPPAR